MLMTPCPYHLSCPTTLLHHTTHNHIYEQFDLFTLQKLGGEICQNFVCQTVFDTYLLLFCSIGQPEELNSDVFRIS